MLAGFAGAAKPEEVQAQTPTRLTVLEFVSSTAWPYCTTAGTAIDALSTEFSRSEAAFIEWHSGTPANRRYQLSESGGGQYVPEVMVDSARLFITGAGSGIINDYRAMIENSQARPALAELSATVSNNGTSVTFNVTVTNNSTVTLGANKAAVHGIVYEDYKQSKTNFAGRGSAKADITSLSPEQAQTLQSPFQSVA